MRPPRLFLAPGFAAALLAAACQGPGQDGTLSVHGAFEPGETPIDYVTLRTADGERLNVYEDPVFNGDCLTDVSAGQRDGGISILQIQLSEDCTREFGQFTSRSIGRRMAVVVEGRVAASPTIRTPILTGSAYIETGASLSETEDLAARIRDRAGLGGSGE